MPVPEATVDEYYGPPFRQDDVRTTGQVAYVLSKPQPRPMKEAADGDFRLCILASDSGHPAASSRWIYNIRHRTAKRASRVKS